MQPKKAPAAGPACFDLLRNFVKFLLCECEKYATNRYAKYKIGSAFNVSRDASDSACKNASMF